MLSGFKITISFEVFIAFFFGIIAGVILLILLYAYSVLMSIKDNEKKIEKINNISDEEVITLIHDAKANYLVLRKSPDKEVAAGALKDVISSIIYDIAKKCNPDSKRPLFELTIDEVILLSGYITTRVDQLLSHKGLGIFRRKLKISQILQILEIKQKVDNNAAVKATKKLGAPKIINTIWMGINVLNPFFWVKKLVTSVSTNIIMKKIFLLTIDIVGQETYKIYSKSAITLKDPEFEKALKELDDAAIEIELVDKEDKKNKKEVYEPLALPPVKQKKAKK